MKRMSLSILILALCLPVTAMAESTNNLLISRIQIMGQTSNIAVYAEGGDWQTGCPTNTVEVIVPNSNTVFKEILSGALAAKFSKSSVRFTGTCDGDKLHAHMIYIY